MLSEWNILIPKMILNTKPEGRRGDGRFELRWLDDTEADTKPLGVRRWELKAQDRKNGL
jgi:hypothetical protein